MADREHQSTLPEGWRVERVGGALDVLDQRGRRVAWLTWEGMVYVERACTPDELRAIAEALRHG